MYRHIYHCVSSVTKLAQILGGGPISIYLKPTLMHKLELEEQVMGRRAVSRCGYHVRVKSAAAIYEVGAASNYHALIAQSAHSAPDRSA